MPYIIKKTDGNIIATVTDGTVDTASTSLTLLGKNFKGIGEIYNENLVYLLENFSNSTPPNNQIKGQLWYNTNTSKLNVYDGNNWRPVGSPFVSTGRPTNLVSGDFWIDTSAQQLKFFDGVNLITAGPIYTKNQGRSGWIVEEIVSDNGDTRLVTSLYSTDVRVAIISTTEFKPLVPIPGFTTQLTSLRAGFTFSTLVPGNTIHAVVASAQAIFDSVDGNLDSTKFIRSDKTGAITGSLTLQSEDGLTLGPLADLSLYVETVGDNDFDNVISSQVNDSRLILRLRSNNADQDAFTINPTNKTVSVYQNDNWKINQTTAPNFLVNANTIIEGTLVVKGATEFTNSTTLQISDKNIELAVVDTPTAGTANGAGVTVKGGVSGDKTITWLNAGVTIPPSTTISTWELNDNLKIPATNSFYIGINSVLNSTTLGPSVVNSSLTSVGDLTVLNVGNLNFATNVISVNNDSNLNITVSSGSIISLTNQVRINNVASPLFQFDVANKDYIDRLKTSVTYLTIDITGLSTPNTDAVAQVEAMIPASTVNVGDVVRALCLTYTSATPSPIVSRVVKKFNCQLVSGIRTWVFETDIAV
jgi:hypothetical protein